MSTAEQIPDHNGMHFPVWLLAFAFALTGLAFGGLFFYGQHTHNITENYRTERHRIQELEGVIAHLDEVLTMSARMAAATNDLRWETRYRQFETQLDNAIRELIARAPSENSAEYARRIDVANVKLVEMEHRSFELVRGHRPDAARALLFSNDYKKQKEFYAGALKSYIAAVNANEEANLSRSHNLANVTWPSQFWSSELQSWHGPQQVEVCADGRPR